MKKMCDCCKSREATYFYKESLNGHTLNIALCDKCAKDANIEDYYNVFTSTIFDDMFQGPFGLIAQPQMKKACKCGCTEDDIISSGRFGCSECYKTFSYLVDSYVNKLGGKTYAGQMPSHVSLKSANIPTINTQIAALKQKLQDAVKKENYALAKQYKEELDKLVSKRG